MNGIKLISVNLGVEEIEIPFWSNNVTSGHNILVTAGLDGDEYTGIEAAYSLIEEYKEKKLKIGLTIIPLVNISGFKNYTSYNPQDGKYPKEIFPGKEKGTSTEKLMFWLKSNVYNTNLWLDLHSGAQDEFLNPFIYSSYPKIGKAKKLVYSIVRNIQYPRLIIDKKNSWVYKELEKKGIPHLIIESGCLGQRRKKDINLQIETVKKIISLARNGYSSDNKKSILKRLYSGVRIIRAKKSGLWQPQKPIPNKRQKNQILGIVNNFRNQHQMMVKISQEEELLWYKTSMYCQKGDILAGLAVNPLKSPGCFN